MADAGTLTAKLILNADDFYDNADKASSKAEKLRTALKEIGKFAKTGLKESVEAATEFETAFKSVEKTVEAPDGDFEFFANLRKEILALSTELPSTANEIANVVALGGQLGIPANNLMDFSKVILMLGSSTDLTSDSAAMMLAQFANVTKLDPNLYENMGSAITALGNNTATTESKIVEMAQSLASGGTQAGMSQAEILGWSAAISSTGIEAAAAGTSFRDLTQNITKAVANGGAELETFAKTSGMSAAEFSEQWGNGGASDVMQAFIMGLSRMSGNDVLATFDALGIAESRQIDMLQRLALNTDIMSDAIGISTDAWEENTALSNEAGKAMETSAAKLQMLKNGLTVMAIELGSALLPVLSTLMDTLKPIMESVSNWIGEHPQLAAGILSVAAGLGMIAPMITTILPALKMFSSGGALAGLGATISGIGAALLPLLPIIAAVGAAIVALKIGYDNNILGMQDTFQPMVESVKGYMSDLKTAFDEGGIGGALDKIGQDAQNLWTEKIQPELEKAQTGFQNFMATFDPIESIGQLGALIGSAFAGLYNKYLAGPIGAFIEKIKSGINQKLEKIEIAKEKLQGIITSITGFFDDIDLEGIKTSLKEKLESAISGAMESVSGWFDSTFGGIGDFFSGLFGGGEETVNMGIKNGLGEMPTGRIRMSKADEAVNRFSGMESGIGSELGIDSAVIDSWNQLRDAISSVLSLLSGMGGGTVEEAGAATDLGLGAQTGEEQPGGILGVFSQINATFAMMKTNTEALIALWTTGLPDAIATLAAAFTTGSGKNNGDADGKKEGENQKKGDSLVQILAQANNAFIKMTELTGALINDFNKRFPDATLKMKEAVKRMLSYIDDLITKVNEAEAAYWRWYNAIIAVIEALRTLQSMGGWGGAGDDSPGVDGQRASGGSVFTGKTYLVGENGPELFSPTRSGYIIPNDELRGRDSERSVVVNFNGDVIGDENSISGYVRRAVISTIEGELAYA